MSMILNFFNQLSDMDSGWFPYLFLRPQKNNVISLGHLSKMSLYFGLTYGGLLGVFLSVADESKPMVVRIVGALVTAICFVPVFFVLWGIIFRIPWNIRARSLENPKR